MNRVERRRQGKKAKIPAKKNPVKSANPPFGQPALSLQQAIDLALQHHREGRLPEADNVCQKILQTDPNQHVALHLLGVIAHQVGKHDIAVDLITKALAINPDFAEAHNNLGVSLQNLGKLDEAVASYKKAIAIKPDYADAHNKLGNVLQQVGRIDEAVTCYHIAIDIKPDFHLCLFNLHTTCYAKTDLEPAAHYLEEALKSHPMIEMFYFFRGDSRLPRTY